MVSSVDFAKYLLLCVQKLNATLKPPIEMNETKLHKLMYICDGILLSSNVNIINENVRAWNYGPVYPKVHNWVTKYKPFETDDKITPSQDVIGYLESVQVGEIVLSVLKRMGKYTAGELSDWSHRPGSPWEKALERNNGIMNGVINKKDMREYFSRKSSNE